MACARLDKYTGVSLAEIPRQQHRQPRCVLLVGSLKLLPRQKSRVAKAACARSVFAGMQVLSVYGGRCIARTVGVHHTRGCGVFIVELYKAGCQISRTCPNYRHPQIAHGQPVLQSSTEYMRGPVVHACQWDPPTVCLAVGVPSIGLKTPVGVIYHVEGIRCSADYVSGGRGDSV